MPSEPTRDADAAWLREYGDFLESYQPGPYPDLGLLTAWAGRCREIAARLERSVPAEVVEWLVEACEAAMRIETLWGPVDGPVRPEHEDEMYALAAMRDKFMHAISSFAPYDQRKAEHGT